MLDFPERLQAHLSCRVPGLLAWEPLGHPINHSLPLLHSSSRMAQPPSIQLPSACTFCALVSGCSLEVKGPLLPSPFSLTSLLPHRPLLLAQFIGLWGGTSLGSGSRWEREGQAKSHSGSHTDLSSVLHRPLIPPPPHYFSFHTNSPLPCQRHSSGEKSLPTCWNSQTAADLRSSAHRGTICTLSPSYTSPEDEATHGKLATLHELQCPQRLLVRCSMVAS